MENINLEIYKFNGQIIGQTYYRELFLKVSDVVKEFSKYLTLDSKHKINLNGFIVKTSTDRMKNIINNIDNFRDDIVPLFFSVERNMKDMNYHLNLYGVNSNGEIVMLNQNDIKGKVFR